MRCTIYNRQYTPRKGVVFDQRIRQLVQECGGQNAMARRLTRPGAVVYASAVQAWLTGSVPMADKVVLIAQEFGVSSDWLLGLTDQRTPVSETAAVEALRQIADIVARTL